jgi:hypothetical protein
MFCLFGIRVPFALRCVHGKLRCAGTPTKSLLRDHAMAPATASPRPLLVCHSGQWPAASRVLPCTPPPLDLALARAVGAPEKKERDRRAASACLASLRGSGRDSKVDLGRTGRIERLVGTKGMDGI